MCYRKESETVAIDQRAEERNATPTHTVTVDNCCFVWPRWRRCCLWILEGAWWGAGVSLLF